MMLLRIEKPRLTFGQSWFLDPQQHRSPQKEL